MSLSERDLVEMEERAVLLEMGLTAHARGDLLALLAEVKRLRAVLAWVSGYATTHAELARCEGRGRQAEAFEALVVNVRVGLGGGTDRRAGDE